jgi:(2R)-ethylmalonyl-CoA mutase
MNVIYEGIRFTPEEIVQQAIDSEGPRRRPVDPLRLTPRSGERHARHPAREGPRTSPSSSAASSPEDDALALKQMGVRRVYTPKDYKITQIMGDVVKVVEETLTAAE